MAEPVLPASGGGQQPTPVRSAPSGHADHQAGGVTSRFDESLARAIGTRQSTGLDSSKAHSHGGSENNRLPKMMSPTSSNPSHFSHDHNGNHDFQQKIVGIRSYQMQLLAGNIANADTPNYKAMDIDFDRAVESLTSGIDGNLELASTAQGHIKKKSEKLSLPEPQFRIPYQDSVDGNTVDMDVERQKMAENSLMLQFSLDRVSGHFKHMLELLQNLK